MANRYIDSEIVKDPWYRKLSDTHKAFWWYVNSMCNIAGIWSPEWDVAKVYTGQEPVDYTVFIPKVTALPNGKWYITDFVRRQQMVPDLNSLNQKNACHSAIIKILLQENILSPLSGPAKALDRGYSNSNSNGNTNTSSLNHPNNSNNIRQASDVIGSTTAAVAVITNYDTPEWRSTLMREVQDFLKIGLREPKIKQMFLTRAVPEAIIDECLGKKF